MKEINGKLTTDERAKKIAKRLKDEDGYVVSVSLLKKILRYSEDDIWNALVEGYEVRTTLGTYDLAYKPPIKDKEGYNMFTGEKMVYNVGERNAPRLRFSKTLKDAIRESTEGNAYVSSKDAKKLEQ